MPKTRIPSPSRSQTMLTPRRHMPRRSRSVSSPAPNASGRLTAIIDQFKEKNMDSFTISPMKSRWSVLTDNTDIEEPRRKSWWKNLNENSQHIMEVLDDNKATNSNDSVENNISDMEILSQENKNYSLDLPESSDNESIHSIVISQRKLFSQKENKPVKKFNQIIGARETLTKLHKSNTTLHEKTIVAGTKDLFQGTKRTKPVFSASLLNRSANKTVADKTTENITIEPKGLTKNIFGNRPPKNRKNIFADFVVSDSEHEISEVQAKIFTLKQSSNANEVLQTQVIEGEKNVTESKGPKEHVEPNDNQEPIEPEMLIREQTVENIPQDEEIAQTKDLFKGAKRSKSAFSSALLNISANKTTADKTAPANVSVETNIPVKNIFGNRLDGKRKNIFADFVESDSERESLGAPIEKSLHASEKQSVHANTNKRNTTHNILNQEESKRRNEILQRSQDAADGNLESIQPLTKMRKLVDSRITMDTDHENNITQEEEIVIASRKELFQATKKANIFSSTLLHVSPNKTVTDKVESNTGDLKLSSRNMFGNRSNSKHRNIFADFLESESEHEISAIQAQENDQSMVKMSNKLNNEMTTVKEVGETEEDIVMSEENQDICKDEVNVGKSAEFMLKKSVSHATVVEHDDRNNDDEVMDQEGCDELVQEECINQESEENDDRNNDNEVMDQEGCDELVQEECMNKESEAIIEQNCENKQEKSINRNRKEVNESKNTSRYKVNEEEIHKMNRSRTEKCKVIDEEVVDKQLESIVSENFKSKDNESEEIHEVNVGQEEKCLEIQDLKYQHVEKEGNKIESDEENEEETPKENSNQEDEVVESVNNTVVDEQRQETIVSNIEDENSNESNVEEEMNYEESDKEIDEQEHNVSQENNVSDNDEEDGNESDEEEINYEESEEEINEVNMSQEEDAVENDDDIDELRNESQENVSSQNKEEVNESEDDEEMNQEESEDEGKENDENINIDEQRESTSPEKILSQNEKEVDNESNVDDEMNYEESEEDIQEMNDSQEKVISERISNNSQDKNLSHDEEADDSENDVEMTYEESEEEINQEENTKQNTLIHNEVEDGDESGNDEEMKYDESDEDIQENNQEKNLETKQTEPVKENQEVRNKLDGFKEASAVDSSAEGSGWDSHRTTRKTLRQTFGKDFTPRKSLRALVMEKSAKQTVNVPTLHSETVLFPQANSTEYPEESNREDVSMESDHELSRRTRQTTLETYLQKMKQQNIEKKQKLEQAVRISIKLPPPRDALNLFKVPSIPPRRKPKTVSNKPKKQIKSVLFEELPSEVIEDMKYKPPKRFQPSNASWITKRLYKYLETKLEPKYDYKARVRAEKLVETIYHFAKDLRRHDVASVDSVDVLKHELARLDVVKTHFEFYEFFHEYMPREIRVKVVPDIVNKIPLPRHGVFSDILKGTTVQT